MFEVSDRLRDCGLRHVETTDRLAHAACSDHGHQDVEVPQLDAASQTFIPWHAGNPFQSRMILFDITTICSWCLLVLQFLLSPIGCHKGRAMNLCALLNDR